MEEYKRKYPAFAEMIRLSDLYRNTPQYQEKAWKLYRENKDKIKEYLKWVDYLGFTEGEIARAKALSYIIEEMSKKHPFSWKKRLYILMKKCSELDSYHYTKILSPYLSKLHIDRLKRELAGKEESIFTKEKCERIIKSEERYLEILKEPCSKKTIYFFTLADVKYYPEWVEVTIPQSQFFHDEKLKIIIQPLIDKDNKDLDLKHELINELHEKIKRHTWKPFFEKNLEKIFLRIKNLMENEISLRETTKSKDSLELIHHLNHDLKINLSKQLKHLKELKKQLSKTKIPHHKKNKEVREIYNKLRKIITNQMRF